MKRIIRKLKRSAKFVLSTLENAGKTQILVLGDSHASIFTHKQMRPDGHYFKVKSIAGATISGLQNPNSVTKALPIFEDAIKNYRGKICITLLGEVDTGFVIWYRAEKYGLDVQEVLEQTAAKYIEFIEKIPLDMHVIIISAPLPTIQDGQNWGEIANARKEVTARQSERTRLTMQLNQKMKSYAMKSGAIFVDLDAESLGYDGLVKRELLNTNREDHHYAGKPYIKMLKPKLLKIAEEVASGNVAPRRAGAHR